MIKAKIRGELNFPSVFMETKDLKHIADRIFIPFMVEALDAERGIDGNAHPSLEQSTLKSKRRLGKGQRTLLQEGKLRKSFRSKPRSSRSVVIDLKANRAEIGKFLQVDGVGSRRKKFVFFGISREMERRARDFVNLLVRKAIKRGGKRRVIR